MTHQMPSPWRTTVQTWEDAELLAQAQAQALKIDLPQVADAGLRGAVSVAGAERWLANNAAALDSSNAYVERYGLPLARFRRFCRGTGR